MIKVNIQAIRDNSFVPQGELFEPVLVERGLMSIDDATGLKIITDKDGEVNVDYYYIGEEIDQQRFEDLTRTDNPSTDLINKRIYAQEFGINRYGVIRSNHEIKEIRPLSPTEHMVHDQETLFGRFNKALTISTQKVLKIKPPKPIKPTTNN